MSNANTITTIAGNGDPSVIGQPFGVEIGPDGALYVCEVENHRITRVDLATGKVKVVVGTGRQGYSGDGGPALEAELNEPYEIRFDSAGNMFFVEMKNHIVRKVDTKSGIISTVAGNGKPGYSGDGGQATKVSFRNPHSIVLDDCERILIADIGNHRIRAVDLKTGIVTTIAGTAEAKLPSDGQKALGNPILGPRALFLAGTTLWIALREGHSVWRMDLKDGILHHVAGTGKSGFTGDGGPARNGTFNGPKGIAVGPGGKVYVVDTENQAIRVIDPAKGTLDTLAGYGPSGRGYGGDNGPAAKAKMDRPHGICFGPDGTVYIGDTNTHRVRAVK
ncbi:MAG: hypothetical protein O3B01_23870 [Planctomycetota bacterium]|nr:hypothetical protein [Planctomycetota bacterium]MDA1141611.1 hypothetical protein [Planctomycetota bacterium]